MEGVHGLLALFQVGTMAPASILHLLSAVMGRGRRLSPSKVSFCGCTLPRF
jgi:hypothetical protein